MVDPPYAAIVFANLVMSGKINSALRYLSENDGGVLPLTDDVIAQLREKHPNTQEAPLGPLLFGPVEGVPVSAYQKINGEIVRYATLRTKGSGGPSGVDANGLRRILASKSFKKSGTDLCAEIAAMTRRLCTDWPIGVGEVIRRIMGKCVMHVTKPDVIDASGSLQVWADLKSGSEVAICAMRNIFEAEGTDAVLLIDASNALNALNRAAALHNIRVLFPNLQSATKLLRHCT